MKRQPNCSTGECKGPRSPERCERELGPLPGRSSVQQTDETSAQTRHSVERLGRREPELQIADLASILATGYLRHRLRLLLGNSCNSKSLRHFPLDFSLDQSVCVEPPHDGDST